MIRFVAMSAVLALALTGVGESYGPARLQAELMRLLDRAEAQYATVQDYTAIMVSRERVKGILEPEKTVLLKFQRPFRVYMRWLAGPGKGREGIFVAGDHDGKFLVSEPSGVGRLVTAALDPSDPKILERGRHPVTDVGVGKLLEIVGKDARRAVQNGVLRLIDRGVGEVAGRRVRQIEGILPQDPQQGYYGYRIILAFDVENHLPIRVVVYDWANDLVEDYSYAQLQLNPGLSGRDFDPENTEYGFPGIRVTLSG